jgi:hypothetical protein
VRPAPLVRGQTMQLPFRYPIDGHFKGAFYRARASELVVDLAQFRGLVFRSVWWCNRHDIVAVLWPLQRGACDPFRDRLNSCAMNTFAIILVCQQGYYGSSNQQSSPTCNGLCSAGRNACFVEHVLLPRTGSKSIFFVQASSARTSRSTTMQPLRNAALVRYSLPAVCCLH